MAYIYFGNLTTSQMLERLGISITTEEEKQLEDIRSDKTDLSEGDWHCFDRPFIAEVKNIETAKLLQKILAPHEKDMKTKIAIGMRDNASTKT